MRKIQYMAVCIAALSLASCASEETVEEIVEEPVEEQVEEVVDAEYSEEKNGILVYEANIATEYPNAKLSLKAPADGYVAGPNNFEFEVTDYNLGIQTVGAEERNCANSGDGQHIHFIVNNAPYKAKYEASFTEELPAGNNVVLAFISRSYHESIKSDGASVLTKMNTSDGADDVDLENGSHLFYSRPKGNYSMQDGDRILLDFYLANTDLAADGNKVRATINGTAFILSKWVPYFVENLPLGENTVRIELIDNDGNPVEGPFNDSGDRTFTITEG